MPFDVNVNTEMILFLGAVSIAIVAYGVIAALYRLLTTPRRIRKH